MVALSPASASLTNSAAVLAIRLFPFDVVSSLPKLLLPSSAPKLNAASRTPIHGEGSMYYDRPQIHEGKHRARKQRSR